jgi:hypothetical protein
MLLSQEGVAGLSFSNTRANKMRKLGAILVENKVFYEFMQIEFDKTNLCSNKV